ncbi:hypothetical protein L228DRAFT_52997 [Xylona heveae TC161]|uniref:BZIP domain-containing protein n=1 Tax=Xylona heveae (strain CBS 132557 / TC161) TaxID=1328760 RepID=A0A164ZFP1_XYLHT|nr:hypothetical protein L228DRAFT_52997 [Xylona heveae TC161]KZF19043.1 hypothetical protein L228DRAFT_52997 [Xylona heveae TC161]
MGSATDRRRTTDIRKDDSALHHSSEAGKTSSPRSDPKAKQSSDLKDSQAGKDSGNADASQPLAPPPRPAQQNPSDTPDYFSGNHSSNHFSLEPNPFEQSFGNPAAETPGKSLLPPVAALASPASLLPGPSSGGGFAWPNSLRSGPLSPAMLTGPTGGSDYFSDSHLRGGFPTPNESSLRTGLTPGGGGSMFPAPSPNSQALFNQFASGGATPGTLDFHRTAMNVAASRKSESAAPTSQPQDQGVPMAGVDQKPATAQMGQQDPFGQHDANDAANGLFLLAQARNGPTENQYAMAGKPTAAPDAGNMGQMPKMAAHSQSGSPHLAKQVARNASVSGSVRGASEMSAEFSDSGKSDQAKANTTAKGKKGPNAKGGQAANGRRKAEDTPSKAPPNKKAKVNNHPIPDMDAMDSDDDDSIKLENNKENSGKKMTDEEKRKNFLERNRVAALKCRQRKKQWLANLQAKVEIFSSENDALSAQVTQLREEIVNLKTLLLAHKDCPVSQAQGLSGLAMNSLVGDFNPHANPYGMAMANGGQMMAGPGMQRR